MKRLLYSKFQLAVWNEVTRSTRGFRAQSFQEPEGSDAASIVPNTGPHTHVARRTLPLVPISQSQDICLWAHDKENKAQGGPWFSHQIHGQNQNWGPRLEF